MGAVYFYHLTEGPLEQVLPALLGRALAQDWRVAVRGTQGARMDALDLALWRHEAFLPHGVAGGPHDARQPVLLTTATGPAANDASCLMAVDGAEVTPSEVAAMARVCILFDGHDNAALAHARGQWTALTGAGCAAQYWAQEDGRWVKKAEKA